ncbi:MAG: FkbM family methyltransferase, partial [Lentisphaeria bacterium]
MPVVREKFLVRMLYPVIDRLFSARLASKIKMCGCILSGDWMIPFPIYCACQPAYLRENTSTAIVQKRFPGLSEETALELVAYFEKLRHLLPLIENREFSAKIFLKSEYLFGPEELIVMRTDEQKALRVGRQYGIDPLHVETASLVYHHGLTFLPEKVLEYIKRRDIIDAGAYDGASCLIFQQYTPSCVYSFEPSEANRKLFLQTLNWNRVDREKYRLIGKGLADAEGMIQFDDTGDAVNDLSKKGEQLAEITTVDLFATANKLQIGVIKADVEGM